MKDFLKMFLASMLAMAVVCVVVFFLCFAVLIGMSALSESEPVVKRGSVLVFDLNAVIQDAPVATSEMDLINDALGMGGPKAYALRDVLNGLKSAADDVRIEALYLKGSLQSDNYGSGYGALKEVREAVMAFKKESGKPVIANTMYPSDKDLYVISAADVVYMNPEGILMNAGMSSEPIFFAGFFKKYGIGVQVTKAGEYKSAAESFVMEKMSDPAREQTRALLEDMWKVYVAAICEKSGMSPSAFQKLIDEKGLLNATDALEAGIVDELAFSERVIESLKNAVGDDSDELEFEGVELKDYIAATRPNARGDHVAVLYAEGPIVVGEGDQGQIGGEGLAREIRKLRQDDKVKAIVLRVNSPGGSALASEVIQHELRLANEKIPVVVSMGSVAASGGYWISAYGDRIFAEPNTITGSIGVIGMFMNFQEIANTHGFTFDVVKTAKFADAMSMSRPKTAEEMAIIQREVDDVYADFLQKVVEGRGQPADHIASIAEGRVWSGEDALELGLVDELGGLQDAIAYAAAQAGLQADPVVRDYPRPKDFMEQLMENLTTKVASAPSGKAQQMVEAALSEMEMLTRFDDPKGVYAILPYQIDAN